MACGPEPKTAYISVEIRSTDLSKYFDASKRSMFRGETSVKREELSIFSFNPAMIA